MAEGVCVAITEYTRGEPWRDERRDACIPRGLSTGKKFTAHLKNDRDEKPVSKVHP